MSLVAYGSSGEESSDDDGAINSGKHSVTVAQENTVRPPNTPSGHISDDDDELFSRSPAVVSGLNLPEPHKSVTVSSTLSSESSESSLKSSLLAGLPKPKAGATVEENEDEIEDFVKKNTQELKAKAEKSSKKRKIVQIAAPSLKEFDSDEEGHFFTSVKPVASAKKKCGLFSVLPAPKNRTLGSGKEAKETVSKMFASSSSISSSAATVTASLSSTQRDDGSTVARTAGKSSAPFVPTSVGRKPRQSSRAAFNLETGMMMPQRVKKPSTAASDSTDSLSTQSPAAPKSGKAAPEADSSDEDTGDGMSSNFFSIANSDDIVHSNPLSASSLSVTSSVSTLPGVGTKEKEAEKAGVPDTTLQDQPLSFRPRESAMQDAPLQFKRSYTGPQAGPSFSNSSHSSSYYNMAAAETAQIDDESQEEPQQSMGDNYAHDEEFLKLQGKSKRGKEEIKFIDVRQDDQIGEVDLNMIKTLSEENANRQSYSKKKNDDMPTSQQRRKHQITYLAFRAKEREVELKDTWAANRQTKRQTQSKYGF